MVFCCQHLKVGAPRVGQLHDSCIHHPLAFGALWFSPPARSDRGEQAVGKRLLVIVLSAVGCGHESWVKVSVMTWAQRRLREMPDRKAHTAGAGGLQEYSQSLQQHDHDYEDEDDGDEWLCDPRGTTPRSYQAFQVSTNALELEAELAEECAACKEDGEGEYSMGPSTPSGPQLAVLTATSPLLVDPLLDPTSASPFKEKGATSPMGVLDPLPRRLIPALPSSEDTLSDPSTLAKERSLNSIFSQMHVSNLTSPPSPVKVPINDSFAKIEAILDPTKLDAVRSPSPQKTVAAIQPNKTQITPESWKNSGFFGGFQMKKKTNKKRRNRLGQVEQ
ncbi:hypothetical protein CYMTET_36237 [Cymbomonas tetramitiformis]|uniref:Uncharacterized protein n=1 Tax=Cymbomonas tetramitiformis TaxID=36881 RepID=A0AAE0CGC0_9CHLO|nr:hypothetical protein CYMTET_36237 [Cymbomonas tetramitiformis]